MSWALAAAAVWMASATAAPEDATEARRYFQWAQRLYAKGLYGEAIAKFEEAYRLKPHPVVFFNLARCYEKRGEPSRALIAYRAYLHQVPQAADKSDVLEAMAAQEGLLEQKGIQQLVVYVQPDDAEVQIDGLPRGGAPITVELPPGDHEVNVAREGYQPEHHTVTLGAQRSLEVEIALTPTPGELPTATPTGPPLAEANAAPSAPALTSPAPARTGPLAGALFFGDLTNARIGGDLYAGYRLRGVDLAAELRLGPRLGVGALAGWGLDVGRGTIAAGARADDFPSAQVASVGPWVSARWAIAGGLGFNTRASFEWFLPHSAGYAPSALVLAAGLEWRR